MTLSINKFFKFTQNASKNASRVNYRKRIHDDGEQNKNHNCSLPIKYSEIRIRGVDAWIQHEGGEARKVLRSIG